MTQHVHTKPIQRQIMNEKRKLKDTSYLDYLGKMNGTLKVMLIMVTGNHMDKKKRRKKRGG